MCERLPDQTRRSARVPRRRGRRRRAGAGPGAATGRDLRHDRQQRHLRGDGRGDVLLGLLLQRRAGRAGLGPAAGLGIRDGREQPSRRGRGRHPDLRLPAGIRPPARHSGRRRRHRLRRRSAAPGGPALGLPPLPAERERPLLHRRQRGGADAAAPALLHLVPDRRPARRGGAGRAWADPDLERLEQDGDRRRLPAGPAPGGGAGRPDLAAQRRVRRRPRDLRPHRRLRRDRLARARARRLRRLLRRRRGAQRRP
jgi:hypothetical protein